MLSPNILFNLWPIATSEFKIRFSTYSIIPITSATVYFAKVIADMTGRSVSKLFSILLGIDVNAERFGDEELRNRLKSLRLICLYRSELVITSMWEQEPSDVVIGELGTEIRPQYTMSRVVQSHVLVKGLETRGVAGTGW